MNNEMNTTHSVAIGEAIRFGKGKMVEECAQTLRASDGKIGDNQPTVVCPNTEEVCEFKYLASAESRNPFGGEIAHALTAGCADAAVGMKVESISYDGYNQTGLEEACHTLRTASGGERDDRTAKVAQAVESELQMVYHENGGNESFEVKGGAMSTIKSESDTTQAHNQLVLTTPTSYIVRRLTPTECERLMGYPDGHTIPMGLQITDEVVEEFQDIFANFAAIMEPDKPVKLKSGKQVRAWLEKVANPETCPDAPRYKCCGNGWAINSARWVLQGVDRFLSK
jgi:site-specific DNA-cytosine methylase